MNDNTVLVLRILAGYLAVGMIYLALFDLITKRLRNKVVFASQEAQSKLISSGNFVGSKVAMLVMVFAVWIFWPAVLVGSIVPGKKGEDESDNDQ